MKFGKIPEQFLHEFVRFSKGGVGLVPGVSRILQSLANMVCQGTHFYVIRSEYCLPKSLVVTT